MANYIVISIGNTDNRLTQQEWNEFVVDIQTAIQRAIDKVHFFGGAPNWERWQNVAWIVETHDAAYLINEIKEIRKKYGQDSAFVMVGEAQFV